MKTGIGPMALSLTEKKGCLFTPVCNVEKVFTDWNNSTASLDFLTCTNAPDTNWSVLDSLIKTVIASPYTDTWPMPIATTSLTITYAKKANVKTAWNRAA